MADLVKIRVGGVPEHFNLPWHLAKEKGWFAEAGIDLEWTDYPGGTGAMAKDLRADKIDVAIILTAGIVRDIINGNESRIIQQYIKTPLIWGAHCPAQSDFSNLPSLKGARFAISRKGSGSHLITYLLSKQLGWNTEKLNFVITGGLEGTRESFKKGESDCLLWEKYTTKPFVDSGEFKRVGEVTTPWPCFVIAGRDAFIEEYPDAIKAMQAVINKSAETFTESDNFVDLIAERYKLEKEDVAAWFEKTEWATDNSFKRDEIFELLVLLNETGIVDRYVRLNKLLSDFCALV